MKNLIINLIVFVLSITFTKNYAQTLTWLGTLPEYEDWSDAYGLSDDGSVVVGLSVKSMFTSPEFHSFRWTAGVMQDLGTLGGSDSFVFGISADGSVVVGGSYYTSGFYHAFRWENNFMQDLGTLGGSLSSARGVSADGSVVVGWSYNASNRERAFYWTAGGMEDLGTLGGSESGAYAISADGSVVVGYASNDSDEPRAFRWTAQTGMQDLGTLGGTWSYAYGVSADGSVVVGMALDADGNQRAFRWTVQTGMQELDTLGGPWSWAYGVSADGSVVVGRVDGGQSRAFRWTAQTGMQDLNQIYADHLQDGSVLNWARAISPDGRYIVGYGRNAATSRNEAFLLQDSLFINSVSGRNVLPEQFMLYQNYPNPFNPSTSIQYAVGNRQFVQLKVYDILGNEIATLVNEEKAPETYEVEFNATQFASGIYFYRLQAGSFVETKKMILIR